MYISVPSHTRFVDLCKSIWSCFSPLVASFFHVFKMLLRTRHGLHVLICTWKSRSKISNQNTRCTSMSINFPQNVWTPALSSNFFKQSYRLVDTNWKYGIEYWPRSWVLESNYQNWHEFLIPKNVCNNPSLGFRSNHAQFYIYLQSYSWSYTANSYHWVVL